jgi:putrescine transport system ATP-binding protein
MTQSVTIDHAAEKQRQEMSEKKFADQPWLDPDNKPQIVIENVSKNYGGFQALQDLNLSIYKGEVFALVGSSGCGKTTMLRMLAGFLEPSAGRISIDGADMIGVPPCDRPVNMMFQSYALFPHMTVEKNVGYGIKRSGLSKQERAARVEAALDMVQMTSMAARYPHQLSGGQRQRVALARALIRQPKVLLLDEPLSALDKKLREATQFELLNIQYKLGTTFIFVTHDQEEAMAMSSRIAVMDKGRIIQVGTPADIYEFPKTRLVADFVGNSNLLAGVIKEIGPGGRVTVNCPEIGMDLVVDDHGRFREMQKVWVAIHPEKIRMSAEPIDGAGLNQLPGIVWELAYLGHRTVYQVKTEQAKLITVFVENARRSTNLTLRWNAPCYISWAADSAVILTE